MEIKLAMALKIKQICIQYSQNTEDRDSIQFMIGIEKVTIEWKMCKIGKWPKYHMIPSNNHCNQK